MRKFRNMIHAEIITQIDKLEKIIDDKTMAFDAIFFKKNDDINYSFYKNQLNNNLGTKLLNEIKCLYKEERIKRPILLSTISENGDIYSLKAFIDNVKYGGFMDYDGYGHYLIDDKMTNIEIYPSDLKNGLIRYNYDKIIWFNR